jgi:hypothetical protein
MIELIIAPYVMTLLLYYAVAFAVGTIFVAVFGAPVSIAAVVSYWMVVFALGFVAAGGMETVLITQWNKLVNELGWDMKWEKVPVWSKAGHRWWTPVAPNRQCAMAPSTSMTTAR